MPKFGQLPRTDEALPHQRIVEANAVMILIVRFGNGEIPAKTRAKDLANVPQASLDRTWVGWDLLGCGGRKVVKRDQLKWKFQFRKVFVVCFEAWLSFFHGNLLGP